MPSSWKPVPLKCWPLTMVWVEPCGFSLVAWFQLRRCVPGVSRTNLVKLRSRMGSSVICLVSKVDGHVGAVGLQELALGRGHGHRLA